MHGTHYRAIDENGQVHSGFSTIENLTDLEHWLNQRGWQPLPATIFQKIGNACGIAPRRAQWSNAAAALFTTNLAQLLSAGVPLVQSLQELSKLEDQRLVRLAIDECAQHVLNGSRLSDAMSSFPGLFGVDYIASVRAGERSGELQHCLQQQASNLRWQANLAERFKTILAYPLFAVVCLIIVFLFVLLYLVPAMLPLLSMSATELPLHSKWLLSLSELLRQSGVFIVLLFAVGVVMCTALYQSDSRIGEMLHAYLLRGTYGQIITSFSLARYARTTALLYESGIEITDAMKISHNMINNRLLKLQLQAAVQHILGGETIGMAMQSQTALPILFVRMVAAGERAGVLGVALRQSADQLQSNGQYSLDRVERFIGPALLCVIGALLLWVAMSVLGPIYSAVGQTGALL